MARRLTLLPPKPGMHERDRKRIEPQKTKKATGGNNQFDRDWMQECAEDLEEMEEPPPGCFWDVQVRYKGYAEDVNPAFFDFYRRGTRQCSGIAYIRDDRGGYIIDLDGIRLQRPCLRHPRVGASVCDAHGGQLSAVRKNAEARLAMAAEKASDTLIRLTDTRDEEGNLVEQPVRVKAANSVLDRVGIKGTTSIEVNIPGYQKVLQSMFSEEEAGEG